MQRYQLYATKLSLIACLLCGAPAVASVSYRGETTISAESASFRWSDTRVSAETDFAAGSTIGDRQLSSSPWLVGSFNVKLDMQGASGCRFTAQNMRIAISTTIDRTYRFDIADHALDLIDGTEKYVTFTKVEVNKVGTWAQTYTWYLKEFEVSNPRIECKSVNTESPSIKLNVNGRSITLNKNPIVTRKRGHVKVPQQVLITSEPEQCQKITLWSPPAGDLAVDVIGPETIVLNSEREGVRPLRAVHQGGGIYQLCANKDAGEFSGNAEIRVVQH